jgi:hypothetical protein
MDYRILLRMQVQENQWVTLGESHIIRWNYRDLIAASSGWVLMNQISSGLATALLPKLNKGIMELTESKKSYDDFEIQFGPGTINEVLKFYQNLQKDCREHRYTEVYGSIVSSQ